jgi:hypothetical protein
VTRDCAQLSIVDTTPLPLQIVTFQPNTDAAAFNCAIQTARFSDEEVLGITPMVWVPGAVVPLPPAAAAALDDVPVPAAAALEVLLLLLLLPQAATPTATAASTAKTSNLFKRRTDSLSSVDCGGRCNGPQRPPCDQR